MSASDLAGTKPLGSGAPPDWETRQVSPSGSDEKIRLRGAYLALRALASSFHPIPTLDHIGLETDRSWATMQLQKESAGIAEHGAQLIATPEGGRGRATILAHGL